MNGDGNQRDEGRPAPSEIGSTTSARILTLARSRLAGLRARAKFIRLRPFDVSSEEGRSHERYRRAALSTLASAAAAGVSLLVGLISVPLTIGYLGKDCYGLWMTLNSLVAMFSFADLGIGNGLLNAVSTAHGRDDHGAIKRSVASALTLVSGLAAIGLLMFLVAFSFVPWARIFNAGPVVAEQGKVAAAVLFTCFFVGLPLGLVSRLQSAFQESFASSLWSILGSALAISGLLVATHAHVGLPWLVLALAGAPLVAQALNGAALFGIQRPWMRPRRADVSFASGLSVLRTGVLFVVLQMAVAVAYTSDNLVIDHLAGPAQVTEYAVPAKLFTIPPLLVGMMLSPLWPAYSEAISRGDIAWVRRTLRASTALAVTVCAVLGGLLVIAGGPILRLWTHHQVEPSRAIMLALAGWTVTLGFGMAVSMLLNGANVFGFQIVVAGAVAVLSIPAKVLFAHFLGLSGVALGTTVVWWLVSGVPIIAYLPRVLRSLEQRRSDGANQSGEKSG